MRAKEFIVENSGRYQQRSTLDNEQFGQLRNNPNVRIMLDLISRAEGNTNYNTVVGGGEFKDFSTHPNKQVNLVSRNRAGKKVVIPSDAAGRYQIMGFNWPSYSQRLGLKDFSPESQDKIAIQMLADRGALNSILKGDFKDAVNKAKNVWTSLPSTEKKYHQGYGPKDWKWLESNVADLKKQYATDKPKDTQVATTEPSTLDKLRKKASDIVSPVISATTTTAKEPPAKKSQPGYYSVGDSHAQGVGGYSGKQWSNLGQKGSSAFDKQHLANIKNIPAGSVVALSLGANDLGSAKLSDIVDQVNKTIAASKAQGHQVVYLLPTASSNPKLQQKREELRQALLKSLDSRDILDLGVAPSGKEIRGGDDVHLDPKGYKKYGEYITQMFTPGAKEPAPQVTTTTKPEVKPEPVKVTKPETSVAQAYIDANRPNQQIKPKPVQEPTKPEPIKQKPEFIPGTPEYDTRMEKLQTAAGDKFSKERAERLEREEEARQEKRMADLGDKWSRENAATNDQPTTPKDDSYYTKFKNLFK